MQTTTIVESKDVYELIQVVQVKADVYHFLDIMSKIRQNKDQLENTKAQLEKVVEKSKEINEDWERFKLFIDKAALMKKKAHFREQRMKK